MPNPHHWADKFVTPEFEEKSEKEQAQFIIGKFLESAFARDTRSNWVWDFKSEQIVNLLEYIGLELNPVGTKAKLENARQELNFWTNR